MWVCPKCQNENEENFRFCWGCGMTRSKIKTKPEVKIPVEPPKIETPKPPEPVKREIVKNNLEPKEYRKISETEDVLPMLARVSGTERKTSQRNGEISLERRIFTIAIRLVGLFLIYQVLIAVPDLAVTVYSTLTSESDGAAANLLTGALVIPAAKLLFYLIAGIYLIAGGGILLWLLADN